MRLRFLAFSMLIPVSLWAADFWESKPFADWSDKFGLSYDFDFIPLTVRGTYQTIHLEDTAQGLHVTADVFTYAADYDVKKWLTLTAEYDHTRQTSQPLSDEYAGQLALRF